MMKVCLKDAEQFAKGGSVSKAKDVAGKGRYGDSMVIHINPDEYKELIGAWGQPTINPHTGMPEFFLSGLKKWLSRNEWVAPVAATAGSVLLGPIAGSALGSLGLPSGAASLLGNTLVGGGIGALTGGSKGALSGALMGGLAAPYLNNALSGSTFGNALGLQNQPTITSYLGSLFGSSGSGAATGAGNPMGYDPTTGKVVPVTGANTPSSGGGGSWLGNLLGGSSEGSGGGGGSGLSSLLVPGMMGLTALSALKGNKGQQNQPPPGFTQTTSSSGTYGPGLQPVNFDRGNKTQDGSIPEVDYYTYGQKPGKQFFTGNHLAKGGKVQPQATAAPPQQGMPTDDGRADTVPALLSHGEYVMDAETVALLGNGNTDAGAKRLDEMRQAVRMQKGKALAKGKISPHALPPLEYLGSR